MKFKVIELLTQLKMKTKQGWNSVIYQNDKKVSKTQFLQSLNFGIEPWNTTHQNLKFIWWCVFFPANLFTHILLVRASAWLHTWSCPSVRMYIRTYVRTSDHRSVCLCVHLSVRLSVPVSLWTKKCQCQKSKSSQFKMWTDGERESGFASFSQM